MTLASLIPIVIKVSVVLTVFSLGLGSTWHQATSLFRQPGLLVRSLLSMNVVMLLAAIAIVSCLDLSAAVKIAIVALSVSPVPPALPKKAFKISDTEGYGISLLMTAGLFALVLVPVSVALVGRLSGTGSVMPFAHVAPIIVTMVLAPLVAGLIATQMAPALAGRLAHPLLLAATVLLVIAVLPVLSIASKTIWAMVGNGVLASLVLFAVIGLLAGHVLGGPNPTNRTLLALASSMRHPGVALGIASLNFPAEKAVLAVILYHMIISTIVGAIYLKWRSRRTPGAIPA
jgi:BASS family bile acid:Na+ symporter